MQRRNAILTAALAILLLGAAALIFWPRQDANFSRLVRFPPRS